MTTKVHCYIYKISETEKGILLLGSVRLWKDFSHSDLIVMAASVWKEGDVILLGVDWSD